MLYFLFYHFIFFLFTASHGLELLYILVFCEYVDKITSHQSGITSGRNLLLAPLYIYQQSIMGPFDILDKLVSNATAAADGNFYHIALL